MNDQISTRPTTSGGWRRWVQLLAAILAAQLAWWLVVQPLLFSKPKAPDRIPILDATVATPPGPDWHDLDGRDFTPVDLPYHDCCHAPGYRAVRVGFDLQSVPPEGLGLIANAWADNFSIHLNDALVSRRGRMQLPDITYHGLERTIYFLSPGLLRPGRNELTFILVRSGIGEFAMAPPLMASYPVLVERMAVRDWVLTDYNIVSYTIGIVLALSSIVLLLRSRERHVPAWMLVLLGTWVARLLILDAVDPPISGRARIGLGYTLMGLLPIAWLNLADAWTGRPIRGLTSLSLLAFGGYAGLTAWMVQSGSMDILDALDRHLAYFGGAATIAAILRLLWHSWRVPDARIWEVSLFLLCVTLMALDLLDLIRAQSAFYNRINTSLPLLMLGLAAAFFARNVYLFRSMNEFNQLLSRKLAESEARIRQVWQERQELFRRSALADERQRIMRDMHDGLGGRLVSLAAQLRGLARSNSGDPHLGAAELAAELQAALDDMRLIVDSLDTAGDDLGMALGAFRARTEPRFRDAGILSTWHVDASTADLQPSASAILDIYRILQEACTNVLRHAGARHLSVRLTRGADGTTVIEVEDDGRGMPDNGRKGHGLDNMKARAARLGAQLAWSSSARGTLMRLVLPPTFQSEDTSIAPRDDANVQNNPRMSD